MTSFIPRQAFPVLDSLPRSYFLGHHRAGLTKMKAMLNGIDLIVECRDYRIPITSRNPLLDENLAGRERIIVYTKADLGFDGQYKAQQTMQTQDTIRQWHSPSKVLFSSHQNMQSMRLLLTLVRSHAARRNAITSSVLMITGMPNVGKSSLLNALRAKSLGRGKAAQTGRQPGVTRKLSTGVKIIEGAGGGSVYMIDTPGVFIPYVPHAESMLKLALCGCVKDTIVPPGIVADYLLYRLNLVDAALYAEYSPPTNDVNEWLANVAWKTGKLRKGGEGEGGVPELEAAALWMVQRWREGKLGRFVLDEVSLAGFERERVESLGVLARSVSQATRADKVIRREASVQKRRRRRGDAG
ncbi:pre-mRNA-splicing factor [Physcia stellaris]|nr:pre-mRNA-splicing factor [Physcia stellaris]